MLSHRIKTIMNGLLQCNYAKYISGLLNEPGSIKAALTRLHPFNLLYLQSVLLLNNLIGDKFP